MVENLENIDIALDEKLLPTFLCKQWADVEDLMLNQAHSAWRVTWGICFIYMSHVYIEVTYMSMYTYIHTYIYKLILTFTYGHII